MQSLPIAYPAFLDLRGRLVLVVGSGEPAERKAQSLLKYGAEIAVIGDAPTEALVQAEADGLLTLERRSYESGDLSGAFLVLCVDSDEDVRRAVFGDGEAAGCFVSAPDAPSSSNFSTPSVLRRGLLQIAVSTAGRAPEVARQVRARLKEEFGEEWAEYLDVMVELRELLASRVTAEERRAAMSAAAESDLLERVRAGEKVDIEALAREYAPGLFGEPALAEEDHEEEADQ